jgi:molybdopterin-guanine dinucleotide biosynthesis protein A
MDNLIGVILCGGESSRMGRDKGRILKEDIPWALYMADKLAPFRLPVIFSVNASQVDDYTVQFPAVRLVVDSAAAPAGGPLRGLFSVHERWPDKDLFLLACDMVDMDQGTIGGLLEAYRMGGPYEFYAYREEGFFQPFCAIYTAAGVKQNGQVHSLQELLRRGKTKSLAVLRSEAFRNYNTP